MNEVKGYLLGEKVALQCNDNASYCRISCRLWHIMRHHMFRMVVTSLDTMVPKGHMVHTRFLKKGYMT